MMTDDQNLQDRALDSSAPDQARVWFLTGEELAATRDKVAKLQARAVRKGFTGRIDVDAVPATRTCRSPGGLDVSVQGFDVRITGDAPRYAGWRFVAAVDHVDGGTVLRYPPGSTDRIRNDEVRAGECDHCHTRRARRSTVLIAHDQTGRVLQVGRSCLKDFLGHHLTPVFLTLDDITNTLPAGHTGTPVAWDVHSVLTYAVAAAEAFGWTSTAASGSGRTPTRDVVRLALAGGKGADQLRDRLAPHLADAAARAPQIRTELLAGLTGVSGYQANLIAVLRGDVVEARQLGLAVSAIPAHQRLHADRIRDTVRRDEAPIVEYVGTVGEKVTLTGLVRTAMRLDGYTRHSPDTVLLILDCGTAVAKMTTTAAWAYTVTVGDRLTVTGTIKAHREWHGTKQTVLTRPKRIEPAQVAATPPTEASPHVWETVTSPRLDGAAAARRATTRPPGRGIPIGR